MTGHLSSVWKLSLGILLFGSLIQGCGSSSSDGSGASGSSPSARQASPLPLGPSFSSISQNIFTPKCVSCHSGTNAQGSTNLTNYDGLVHNTRHTDLVTPGKPEASHLYEVTHNGEMPPGGPALSAEEIQAISGWISAGALNN